LILAMLICVVLVVATIVIHYEALRVASIHLPDIPVPARFRIIFAVLAAFAAHTVEVWLYGVAYWAMSGHFAFGALKGPEGAGAGFEECLYFSAVTYSTVGFGDLYSTDHLRLVAGVEALNGLLLIGWSASFTYLTMQEYWPMHGPDRRRRHQHDRRRPQG
jgi:hypothetical protein